MHTDPRGPPELSSAVLKASCPYKATVRGTSQTNIQVKGLTAGSASTYIFPAGYLCYFLFLSLNIPSGNDSIEHGALNEFRYRAWHFWALDKCNLLLLLKSFQPQRRRKQWHPTPVLLPGKSHGRRSLEAAVHGVSEGRTQLSNFTFTFHFHALEKEMATHSSVLAWRIPGTGEPGGLPSMGLHRVKHDWSNLAAIATKTIAFLRV